jgi:hypothetical protein
MPATEPQGQIVVNPPAEAVVVLPPTGAEASVQLFPEPPVAPVDPLPDVIVTRLNVTPADAFTKTAMLDSPGIEGLASGALNAMSSTSTAPITPVTSSVKVGDLPVTTGTAVAEYAQTPDAHVRPP